MIKTEYLRFLQTLNTDYTTDNVRKIANLVLSNLDTLIPLSTNQGKRINKVVEIAQFNWESITSDIQIILDPPIIQTYQHISLKSLSVGPFRGFVTQEDFDLSSKLVLIYGPNGTGKSSFCEALEYGLIGSVAEAESKRFRNQNEYFKNAHSNTFTAPILVGVDNEGNETLISPNESLYRFCFIEKNRIDSFSRIAAQAPAIQTELISSLFGLDAFSEFVHNFTGNMDGRYIDFEGAKLKELSQKRQALSGYQQQLETLIPEELRKLDEAENVMAKEYHDGFTFSQIVIELYGNEGNTGLIDKQEKELQQPIGTKSEQTLSNLHSLQKSISSNIHDLFIKQQVLVKASQQISFKKLFETVLQIQESSPEKCPACQTPISQVTINPFEYATSELKKLQHLSELQEATKILNKVISFSLTKFSQVIDICCNRFFEDNPLKVFQIGVGNNASIDWWNSLHNETQDGIKPWDQLEIQIKQLEDIDKAIDVLEDKRIAVQIELKRLRSFGETIIKLQTRREAIIEAIKKAKVAISEFDIENKQLIDDAESEKAIIIQNKFISDAYNLFVQKLNEYKNGLPAQLVEDLGELIVTLYNAFNRNDADHEKLAVVRLPLQKNEKIEISFNGDPDTFFDALHILSEGHIRCIGLSILTAKNMKEECPYLIFDDPVNAIDDDHRESIRRTMFEDTFFKDKQIILTCHGEEFLKDIQNLLSAEKSRQSKTFSFLPKIRGTHISVDRNSTPRNYIIASRTHYERNEIRDALDKSRKALESLTKNKVWKYVNRNGDGNLSIKLRSATAPIELRNLTEQLKFKITKSDFSDQNKSVVLSPLESLLGISGDSREWRYLNKGTHEEADRAEFDRNTVNEIISRLEQIDSALE